MEKAGQAAERRGDGMKHKNFWQEPVMKVEIPKEAEIVSSPPPIVRESAFKCSECYKEAVVILSGTTYCKECSEEKKRRGIR